MTAAVRVALIGPRGAGKTSVGRRLAELCAGTFADLDDLLTRRFNARGEGEPCGEAGEVLARLGEPAFRDLETEALRAALDAPPDVLATGGGVVEREANRALLVPAFVPVYLKVDARTLEARIRADATLRPALEGADAATEAAAVLARREPAYLSLATFVVDAGSRNVDEVAAEILRAVGARR